MKKLQTIFLSSLLMGEKLLSAELQQQPDRPFVIQPPNTNLKVTTKKQRANSHVQQNQNLSANYDNTPQEERIKTSKLHKRFKKKTKTNQVLKRTYINSKSLNSERKKKLNNYSSLPEKTNNQTTEASPLGSNEQIFFNDFIQIVNLNKLFENNNDINTYFQGLSLHRASNQTTCDFLKNKEQLFKNFMSHSEQILKEKNKNTKEFLINYLKNSSKDVNHDIFVNLVENLLIQIESFFDAFDKELEQLFIFYEILFFNDLLQKTTNDKEKATLEEKIRNIWFAYLQTNNHLIEFKFYKISSIVDYANKKITSVASLIQGINNIRDLDNENFLNFLMKIQETINSNIENIQIDCVLPNTANAINGLYLALNDAFSGMFLLSVSSAEKNHNLKNPGFSNFFKRYSSPLTNVGLISLMNVLMFKNYSKDPSFKYSLSIHDWYSSNYRIPSIVKIMSVEDRDNAIKLLNLQKSIIIKFLKNFNTNYQTKKILTKKDYKHILKLLSKLKLITNMLNALDYDSQKINLASENLKTLKFDLNSLLDALKYAKRNSYNPTQKFFDSKKKTESEVIMSLTSEKNNKKLNILTKIIYEFFYNSAKQIHHKEKQSWDLG
ncbi:hypothetical protein [Alphaproteobacteria bacterium endosymbiont of Tiliacea citrago]|uniref:hypothetical protein n=1 Tax=Alphaproteobacteria bacterium endosymbiont of Tiliacea citrago TaxID=3077944 RepID=UPI00313F3174